MMNFRLSEMVAGSDFWVLLPFKVKESYRTPAHGGSPIVYRILFLWLCGLWTIPEGWNNGYAAKGGLLSRGLNH